MQAGVLMAVLGALCFGLLGCISKVAERKKCNPSALVMWVFGWAALVMLGRSLTLSGRAPITWPITALAVACGICAAVAYLAFQTSIAIGKVTLGWLMMNLSAGIPALVSLWLYREKFTGLKAVAFGLAALSLLCLFQGNRLEAQASAHGEPK